MAGETLLDELMPVGVAHLRSHNEAAVMAALPMCTAYVNRLKDPGAAEHMPRESAAAAEGTLRAVLEVWGAHRCTNM